MKFKTGYGNKLLDVHKNFLDIIRNFTIFEVVEGKTIKKITRYQQYRAVHKTIEKITKGKNKKEKGGVIWHTQGSGKSLTMVFLAQVIRRNEELKKYKLLYITDRTQLDTQLTTTFQNTQDETVLQADSVKDLRELISKDSSDLITSTIQKFQEICKESNTQAANINSPGQIVISGLKSDIDNAVKIASDRGAKRAIPLKVSGAFHSYLMSSALSEMNEAIKNVTFNNSSIPLIANCSSKPMSNVSEIREELSEQLCGCVYWQRGIEHMANEGITTFYEFGPGKVLSGMVKRISENSITHSVSDYESLINLQPEN